MQQRPSIGRIVIYRSRTGGYDVPAIVTATTATLNRTGVEAGYVPDLTSPDHVHLTVLTPGIPGLGNVHEEPQFLTQTSARAGGEPVPIQKNAGGTYQEWDIPMDAPEGVNPGPAAGTWRWPVTG